MASIFIQFQFLAHQILAEQLHHDLLINIKEDVLPRLSCLSHLEVETLVDVQKSASAESTFNVFIISTYTDGNPPDNCTWFCKSLEEHTHDFRVSKSYLGNLKYAVFGLGNSIYEENYNKVG